MSTKDIPEVIYHYTSNDALLKILRSKALRMSSRHHLNDEMEGEQFLALVAERFDQEDSDKLKSIKAHLERFEPFVTCFSSEPDLLSQWRGYASDGTGVSIGFKKQPIIKAIGGGHEFLLCMVKYTDIFDKLPKHAKSVIDAILGSNGIPGEQAFHAFAKERWSIKPKGFSEEKEIRLILTINRQSQCVKPGNDRSKIDYYATSTEVREFFDFDLGNNDGGDFIESITLGPKNKTNEEVLRRCLADLGFDRVKIKHSNLSYR